ncbi:MAG: GAF domain-containing protein [Xenococcaceae cyanobacterium MO_188.B32]|nr:GAF domain-containing protein [Xenococcaceae cyanobacterium MO_188.B32]
MSSELTTDKWLNLDAVTPETLDLNNCDREPIHIPNSIQPHGILLTVIAEAANEELEPYLGLHYPATDIPKQAKHLFTLKSLRLIPDVAYEPVGITPELNPLTNERLDMSLTVLRSVSPFHIEYLDNMGVGATLVVSLIENKQLWGLISCHHNTPKKVSYEIRTVCEFIGQIASFELTAKEHDRDLGYKMKLKSIQ